MNHGLITARKDISILATDIDPRWSDNCVMGEAVATTILQSIVTIQTMYQSVTFLLAISVLFMGKRLVNAIANMETNCSYVRDVLDGYGRFCVKVLQGACVLSFSEWFSSHAQQTLQQDFTQHNWVTLINTMPYFRSTALGSLTSGPRSTIWLSEQTLQQQSRISIPAYHIHTTLKQ